MPRSGSSSRNPGFTTCRTCSAFTDADGSGRSTPDRWAIVALGSNLGDSSATVSAAMQRLQELSRCAPRRLLALAQCSRRLPARFTTVHQRGRPGLQPRAEETPENLLAKLQALEKKFGRRPKQTLNESRPLDLDLIAFGALTRGTQELTLPHPRAHLRRFVLAPLAEIAPHGLAGIDAKRAGTVGNPSRRPIAPRTFSRKLTVTAARSSIRSASRRIPEPIVKPVRSPLPELDCAGPNPVPPSTAAAAQAG